MKSARVYFAIRCMILLCSTYVFGDMTSSSNPALVGQPVVFTVQINAPSGILAVPTGSITLTDGGTVLGIAPLQNGSAAITASFTVEGEHSIVASYSGDQNFQPSSTAPLVERITASDLFTLAVTPSTVGQRAGGTANVQVTVFANGTSPGAVQLSCENLPPGASCSFTPDVLQPTDVGQMTILTVTSAGSQVALKRAKRLGALAFALPFVLGGVFTLSCVRKRSTSPFLFLTICVFGILSLAGCSNTLKIVQGGTPAGSYTVRIVGNSGTFAQSTPLSVNITP